MRIGRPVALLLLVAGALPACSSGRTYKDGVVTREYVHAGLFDFARDEHRVSYGLLWEHLLSTGASWAGNQYISALGGAVTLVNVPGLSWILFYPFQYNDLTDSGAHVFGIGSGDGDLRVSVLWGLISLGRNWNLFFINGFWAGHDDPVFSTPPEDVLEEFRASVEPEAAG